MSRATDLETALRIYKSGKCSLSHEEWRALFRIIFPHLGVTPQGERVQIVYTNYKGETALRTIEPRAIYAGSNEWHPESQWLLEAWDVEKQAERTFAMQNIHAWIPGTCVS